VTPKRHILGSNHIFWYIICIDLTFGLGYRWVAEKKEKKGTRNSVIFYPFVKSPASRSLPIFALRSMEQRNHLCKVSSWSVEGSRSCEYPKFRYIHRKAKSHLKSAYRYRACTW
jgi:hypothetical protein